MSTQVQGVHARKIYYLTRVWAVDSCSTHATVGIREYTSQVRVRFGSTTGFTARVQPTVPGLVQYLTGIAMIDRRRALHDLAGSQDP